MVGNLRAIYDARAKDADYENWHEFITELHLEEEDASQCFLVLRDMIDQIKLLGDGHP